MRQGLLVLSMLLLVVSGAMAQDPVEVDPDHYQVAFENEHVRVLLINYNPGESSVMHYHPASVAIFLTDLEVEFAAPDGSKVVAEQKAGDVAWAPAGRHLPTNLGDEPLKVYQIELKELEEGGEGEEAEEAKD